MPEQRIRQYRRAVEAVIQGTSDPVPTVGPRDDELAKLGRAVSDLGDTLGQSIEESRKLEKLAHLTARIDAGLGLEEVLDQVFEAFQTIIPYERIGCALMEAGGQTARSIYARSTASEIKLPVGYWAPVKGSSLQTILEQKRPRILNDLEAYLREHPDSESTRRIVAEGFRSSLTCPLFAMGKPVGFLFFSSTKPHTYSEAHVEIYLRIAEHVSLIIEKGRLYQELTQTKQQLEVRNRFIQEVFGRYTSEEVASQILASPQALKIGGETRKVSIVFSDLCGFTELSSTLDPQDVVRLLNVYLGAMADVIMNHRGTIDELLGDGVLAIFGAPILAEDDARRAVACALSMQRAMVAVNRQLTAEGLPTPELKIGVHTGEVVVGNIGSDKRAKYGIVGPPVNLVSRIQAYCSGGQILCSEDTLREVGDSVEFDECVEVRAKGFREVIRTFSVRGFDAQPELSLPRRTDKWATLAQELPVRFRVVVQNRLGEGEFVGNLSKLSQGEAEIHGIVQEGCPLQPTADAEACPLLEIPRLTDLALVLNPHELVGSDEPIYAQVTQLLGNEGVLVRFTSVSPMQRRLLDQLFASASQDNRAVQS